MRRRCTNIFFFLLLIGAFISRAQDHGFFNQVWLEQGLSQSSIISMIQDKQGFMWFATQDGLNRYDGRNIDHFNFKPFDKQSISGDDIYSICLRDNSLYVLNDKGLDKIDLGTLNISNLKPVKDKEPKTIFFKSWILNNELYLLSRDGLALAKENGNAGFNYEYCVFDDTLKTKTNVYAVCQGENKTIYAATSKGIFARTGNAGKFKKIYAAAISKTSKNETDAFYITITCKNNRLYFTNAHTLFCLNLSTKNASTLPLKHSNAPTSILIDNLNKIWIGTAGQGLLMIKERECDSLCIEKVFVKSNNSRFTLQSNEITSLYQNPKSNEDIVWIGTRDAGAFNYSYSKNSFSIPTSFVNTPDPNFFGIAKDKNDIIWAGFNSGILKLDVARKTFQTIDLKEQLGKTGRPVQAICCDAENNVWTAFGNSLFLIDKRTGSLLTKVHPLVPDKPNNVAKISELNSEDLLLCTSRGLVVYNRKTNATHLINTITVKGQKLPLENVESFFADSKGNWWMGSFNGLYCLRHNNDNVYLKHDNNDSNSILSNRVMDINESTTGEIIVATTKGLSLVRGYGEQIKNIYSAKGLSNNFIYGTLRDNKGNFWMTTNFGLSVFNPETYEFKSYTASDGICMNEFNSGGFYKTDKGELIFGGLGGLVSIYPEGQVVTKSVSDIVLRKMTIENYSEKPDLGKTLSLSYRQNDLNFEFSVPDYSGEKNLTLFYRFKNKDTNLIKVNLSQLFYLSFANLAPGNYNLEVIAINKEGARSTPFSVKFNISGPFWSTWWFYLIIVSLTVFLSWVNYRSRLKRKISYIQQIEQIRKDENEKVRKAAALDLHDEFGNGLTRISMLIEMIKIHMEKENRDAHKLLDLISQNSNRLYQGTKDFIWSINPGKDNMYEIAIRIKDFADELFYGTNVIFELNGLSEELRNIRQTPTAGRNIAMIFKESLSNILKHARAAKVRLTVRYNSENIYLVLEDDGIGFEMKDYKNSFGITNIQQRAGRLDAEITIHSVLNKGTEIVLVINRKNEENDSNAA